MILCDSGDHKPANIDAHYEPYQLSEMFDYHIGRAMQLILQAPHEGHAAEDYKQAKWHIGRQVIGMDNDDIITPNIQPLNVYALSIIVIYAAHNDLIATLFSDVGRGCIDCDSMGKTAEKLNQYIELFGAFGGDKEPEEHSAEFETIERVKRE